MTGLRPRTRDGAPPRLLGALMAACLLLGASAASAHGPASSSDGPLNGLEIANLTHGEMAVVADYAPAIRDLAQRVVQTDPTFRRLLNHAALQRAYCLWGVMPGSLTDEESPFNECSHAYLATLRTLLVHMRQMPGQQKAAQSLAEAMQREMVRREAASELCSYSAEGFNTAQVVMPRWQSIAAYPPTLLAFTGGSLMLGAGLSALFATGRRRS